jgi:acyl carrier protein phosphodiesterase
VNYLAHAYLSFDNPEILTGNLISDFVKGKKKFDYPEAIQKGISLHRAIDSFTDNHEATRAAKAFFREAYRLYAGALVDVVYDHFLANDPSEFPPGQREGPDRQLYPDLPQSPDRLAAFAEKIYEQLAPFSPLFPDRFARMFPYMRSQNWLYNYRFKEGIYSSFSGLARRAAYMPDPGLACRVFDAHYLALQACYKDFFPHLKEFASSALQTLLEDPEGN